MNFLKNNVGYNGWRYDLVKGYAPEYVREYNGATSPQFSVGEFYDGNADLVQSWVRNSGSDAFDFPLRFTLKDAVRLNSYGPLTFGGFIGRDASKSITFTDNHDTARAEYGGAFGNSDQIKIGYAFILTHPGAPMVFWGDYQNSSIQSAIKTLISIRKSAGITSTTSRFVDRAENGLYAAYIGSNLAVKIGTNNWSPPDAAFKLRTSGNNYAVWTK
jgi:alpha-amylase